MTRARNLGGKAAKDVWEFMSVIRNAHTDSFAVLGPDRYRRGAEFRMAGTMAERRTEIGTGGFSLGRLVDSSMAVAEQPACLLSR